MAFTSARARSRLVDLDPDLVAGLPAGRAAAALQELTAPVFELRAGEWEAPRAASECPHLGFLILEGIVSREVVVGDTVSPELLGPGDIARPWPVEPGAQLLRLAVRWNVLADARVAALDTPLATRLARYPEVSDAMLERLELRAQRLAVVQAIGRLGRIEARLEALFWHLADRWGRVTPAGVVVPLRLSHRLLAQLVGARRPTVSAALRELAVGGRLVRRADATWLLTGEPVVAGPAPEGGLVRPRRRLLATEEGAVAGQRDAGPGVVPQTVQRLRADIARLRDETTERAEALQESCATSAEICRSATVLRERRLARMAG